jgi:hypothetical protein
MFSSRTSQRLRENASGKRRQAFISLSISGILAATPFFFQSPKIALENRFSQ